MYDIQTYERAVKKGMDLKDLIDNFGKGGPPAGGTAGGAAGGATGIITMIISIDIILMPIINMLMINRRS